MRKIWKKTALCLSAVLVMNTGLAGCGGGDVIATLPATTVEGSAAAGTTGSGASGTEAAVTESTAQPVGGAGAASTFTEVDETVYTTDSLNLRALDNTSAEIVAKVPAGTELKRTGAEATWSRVVYNGKICYAASQYLKTTAPVVATTAVAGTTAADKSYLQNVQGLPNDLVTFGYSKEVTAENVPTGASYYKSLYGKYAADWIQDTTQKVIYLTMDEGYEAGYTPGILDTLKAKGVHAVFFVTKQFYDSSPELIQRMIDEGHTIGNHTCAHPAGGMPTLGYEAEVADITKLNDLVKSTFGYQMKLFRFPEGYFSEQSLALVEQLGYRSVFWSYAYGDYNVNNQPDVAASLQKAIDALHPGAIYLLHAVSATNAAFLGDWIDAARAKGFTFGEYPVNN